MRSLLRPMLVRCHLAVVLVVIAVLLGMWATKGADGNIGAGLMLILLELLGLPWSLPLLLVPGVVAWPGPVLLAIAAAVLNVVLHGWLRRRNRRRVPR